MARGGRWLSAACLACAFGGCYLSHGRTIEGEDAGRDAPARDAASDAPVPLDVPLASCDRLVVSHTAALDGEARGAVTPRLVALPGGEVGVFSVRTDGEPTRVLFERRDARLSRVSGPVTLASDSFSWAEPLGAGDSIRVAFALGDGASAIETSDREGRSLGRVVVRLEHPSIFLPTSAGYFWAQFEMRADNALVLSSLDPSGAALHAPARIELGRYGSGHHAAVLADGRTVVVGYPREGPPGVRHGYVRTFATSGVLGPERQLSEDDITSVWPVRGRGEDLLLVWNGDALGLERLDPATLEPRETEIVPPIEGRFVVGTLDRFLVVASFRSTLFHVDVYDETLSLAFSFEESMPASLGVGSSIATLGDALVVAAGLSDGVTTYPWLARIACVSE